ncbi:trafficking protein particle complex subunit 2-like protein [Rhypophila decipiens]|uniref:Trafficking protein particle complex subunit 2-like protein n=1 Tax=Rhypophila decipiens TaxID=261697 RepID=A0AAN6YEM3_9PEZI|nr:trafficking protein particle complex subunit 2-like protein [Rhypophila decipiens]
MATAIPSIACLGVIGRNNNPLHISIFPSYDPPTKSFTPVRTPLQFSLLLSSTLDVFDLRARNNAASGVGLSGDYGLLHAVDERLACYGYETNTGTKFVVVVDMRGRRITGSLGTSGAASGGLDGQGSSGQGGGSARSRAAQAGVGLREGEMKPVFKAMQTAYIKLLQNPFYDPDEHAPPTGRGGKRITSRTFADDMRRIGENWTPGVTNL